MSNWFKRITSLITAQETSDDAVSCTIPPTPPSLFKPKHHLADINYEPSAKKEEIPVSADLQDEEDNFAALKRLRDLPRGTQVDSRIAAIKNLLGEGEIFKTLKMLRWPQGVVCPRCHSSNIVRRDPPSSATDKRHYYICLNCKGEGSPSDFDDFTGLPIGSLHSLRQWILCWYLLGFCSINQISKVLGIGINEVLQMATVGSEITTLPEDLKQKTEKTYKEKQKKTEAEKKARKDIEHNEEFTRSASKSPLKPGYKSKK